MIDAFALVRDRLEARLVIVGDGPERGMLEVHARQSGAAHDIRFEGHSASPEKLLSTFDVFAMSSDTEQMPLSLLEAMASGLPVVATDVGDIRQVLAQENQRLLVGRNTEELASALASLLQSPEQRALVGAANRRRAVEAFNQGAISELWRRLWDGKFPY
jgi:glycosyltransferase involved in cell wall biosynthesis